MPTWPTRYPPGAIPLPGRSGEVFAAVVAGARTVREVGAALDLTSPAAALTHVSHARRVGLVASEPGRHGTLHTRLTVVWPNSTTNQGDPNARTD